ncbi:MAG: hypothetical protein IJN87_01785 [Firmicutes bacterium]|nr:hypothetical protein [Bacillota bacterium]
MKKDSFAITKARRTIEEIAKAHGVTYTEVYKEIQVSIDDAWATDDLAAMKLQRELFPDGKPTPEQFLSVLSKLT